MSDIKDLKKALADEGFRKSFQDFLVDNKSADVNGLEFWIQCDKVAKMTEPDGCIAGAKQLVEDAKTTDELNIDLGALNDMEQLMAIETMENALKMVERAKQAAVELLVGDYRWFKRK